MDHFSSYEPASQSWYSTFASFGSFHAASISSAVACGFGSGSFSTASLAIENCFPWAVLDEGGHPGGPVLGREQAREQRGLQPQPGVQVDVQAAVDGQLGRGERPPGGVGELAGPLAGGLVHVVRGHDL